MNFRVNVSNLPSRQSQYILVFFWYENLSLFSQPPAIFWNYALSEIAENKFSELSEKNQYIDDYISWIFQQQNFLLN
jgi:hypothetical protein